MPQGEMPGLLAGQMRGRMMDRPLLVTPLLRFAADFHGDTAIVTRSVEGPVHRTTYAEVWRRTQRLANALVALGVKPGDRVATLAWNTWRHLELYFAISGIGAVCHTVNPRLSVDQLRFILGDAEDVALFFDLTFAEQARSLAGSVASLRAVVGLGDGASVAGLDPAIGARAYEDLLAAAEPAFDFPEFDENAAASLCYTSGTTGNPKGVLYSHRALVLHSFALTANFWLNAAEVSCPVVPMFHVNAWGVPYAAPMGGAALVLPGRALDGESLFALMDGEGVTCAQGVPTVWMGLIDAMRKAGRKPRALKRVVVGGAALSEAMIGAFEDEFGIEANHAWGMTEMSPLGVVNVLKPKFAAAPRTEQVRVRLKQGRVVAGVDMRVVDAAGRVLPNDGVQAGHLQVRGPWIAAGYFRQDAPATTLDGWFDTGDVATIDADGYMQITDRAKDIIKSGGEWISSVILENAAMGHPGILHAAVVGVRHPRWQERPLLICVARGDTPPTLEQVNAYLATKVPKWWLPDAVEFVDALPLGSTGKIQKSELRARYNAYVLPGCEEGF
jgi:fatty-acyl-CoA synthase